MIACCGLNCKECPTYRATQDNNDEARQRVATQWSKMFHMNFSIGDINCDGCLSGSDRMFGHCRNCQIRSCSIEKEYDTCAECDDYPCNKLSAFFQIVPYAREALETIRSRRPEG